MNILDRIYPAGTFDGHYEPSGSIVDADFVIGQSFGLLENDQTSESNKEIAEYIAQNYTALPLYVDKPVAQAMHETDIMPELTITGAHGQSKTTGSGLTSWGIFEAINNYNVHLRNQPLERPIIVAHAYHVGRVAMQAVRFGFDPIIPEGLPTVFDSHSAQWWTRSPEEWAIRSAIGNPVLALTGKL